MIELRPLVAQDRDAFQAFVRRLSAQSRLNRFLAPVRELSPAALDALTGTGEARQVALVAIDGTRLVGEGRYVALGDSGRAEFAVAVDDELQRNGIGTRLLNALLHTARDMGLKVLEGEVLRTNSSMLGFVRHLGFRVKSCPGEAHLVIAERELDWARRTA